MNPNKQVRFYLTPSLSPVQATAQHRPLDSSKSVYDVLLDFYVRLCARLLLRTFVTLYPVLRLIEYNIPYIQYLLRSILIKFVTPQQETLAFKLSIDTSILYNSVI